MYNFLELTFYVF